MVDYVRKSRPSYEDLIALPGIRSIAEWYKTGEQNTQIPAPAAEPADPVQFAREHSAGFFRATANAVSAIRGASS